MIPVDQQSSKTYPPVMRYAMHEKLLCWGDDFIIKNEDGDDIFFVDGKAFSLGNKLSFQDMDGNELAFISQKLLSWGPSYEIYRDGDLYATVKKQLFTFFSDKFEVDIPGPNDYHVEGNLFDYEYEFTRTSGQHAAGVSKKWFSWSDTYGIDIAPGEDDVLILAAAVVIDQVCHDNKNQN